MKRTGEAEWEVESLLEKTSGSKITSKTPTRHYWVCKCMFVLRIFLHPGQDIHLVERRFAGPAQCSFVPACYSTATTAAATAAAKAPLGKSSCAEETWLYRTLMPYVFLSLSRRLCTQTTHSRRRLSTVVAVSVFFAPFVVGNPFSLSARHRRSGHARRIRRRLQCQWQP